MLYLKTLFAIDLLLILGLIIFRVALIPSFRDTISIKTTLLLLLTPAIALLSGNIYFFFAYLICAIGFTSRTRAEVCGTYITLIPMMPVLGLDTYAGSLYLLPVSAVFAMNVGAFIGFLVTPAPANQPKPRYDLGAALLLLMFVYIDSRNVSITSIARSVIGSFVGIVAPYILFSRSLSSRGEIDRVIVKLVMVGTLCALFSVFQMLKHWVLFELYYQALHIKLPMLSASLNMRGGLLRSGGTIVDSTAAGLFLAIVLVTVPSVWNRFRLPLGWLVVAILIAGLFAAQSRGAWIAAIAGFLFILACRNKWRQFTIVILALTTVQITFTLVLNGKSSLAEIVGRSGASVETANYRSQLFWRGLQEVAAHPLFGQTPQGLVADMVDMAQGQHIIDFVNTHLYMALACGLPLFAAWVVLWAAPVFRSYRLRRAVSIKNPMAEAPGVIIVSSMVALIATSAIDRNLLWAIVALGLATPCYAALRSRRVHADAPQRPRLVAAMPTLSHTAPLS